MFKLILLALFSFCCSQVHLTDVAGTSLIKNYEDYILLISTLSGHFIAVNQITGQTFWEHKDEPVIWVPVDSKNSEFTSPIILPDPKDGSLYLFNRAQSSSNINESLKKLPFTIPQLVTSAPCKSSDGILYTGKKSDQWFVIEPHTGKREQILGWNSNFNDVCDEEDAFFTNDATCPKNRDHFRDGSTTEVHIGRTKYQLLIRDKFNKKWNVTFYDYASESMNINWLQNYELQHFTSSSNGEVVTVDRQTRKVLWKRNFDSPVIGIYFLQKNGLTNVPFISVAHDTLEKISTATFEKFSNNKLYPTLYIGEFTHGLYAFPSYIDQSALTIKTSNSGPLLIDGFTVQNSPLLLGYYNVPLFSDTKIQLASKTLPIISDIFNIYDYNGFTSDLILPNLEATTSKSMVLQTDDSKIVHQTNDNSTISLANLHYLEKLTSWLEKQENKGMKFTLLVLIICMILMFWHFNAQVREFQQISQGSNSQNSVYSDGPITAISQELDNGLVRIGKIQFDPNQVLGRGCEGTFVYKGNFEGRSVAVKRLLPECFSLADREVTLLRESDAHPNVIRYHCTERDKQFRYIALELCQTSLYDYVMKKTVTNISRLEILKQTTAGLAHLHSLDIVHRDIKPQNVLLWINERGSYTDVRVMISDFGLCKKLQIGRTSFSRRSGVTGTDGWIAPEMLNNTNKTTTSVDIFSMGCVFYFVLSNGKHPFGESLKRQANILQGCYCMEDLEMELSDDENLFELSKNLIENMIDAQAKNRTNAIAVLKHPMFWSKSKILQFFQDVSDRVEKSTSENVVLQELEKNSLGVVKSDWRLHIDNAVASDLRKYRSYVGHSVRDLLRALRNKKHHYRELAEEAQKSLGEIPDSFTDYWTKRFPILLLHTWLSMQCVKHEAAFKNYYHDKFTFPITYKYINEQFLNDANNLFNKDTSNKFTIDEFSNGETNPLFKMSLTEKMSLYKYNKYKKKYKQTDRTNNLDNYINKIEDLKAKFQNGNQLVYPTQFEDTNVVKLSAQNNTKYKKSPNYQRKIQKFVDKIKSTNNFSDDSEHSDSNDVKDEFENKRTNGQLDEQNQENTQMDYAAQLVGSPFKRNLLKNKKPYSNNRNLNYNWRTAKLDQNETIESKSCENFNDLENLDQKPNLNPKMDLELDNSNVQRQLNIKILRPNLDNEQSLEARAKQKNKKNRVRFDSKNND